MAFDNSNLSALANANGFSLWHYTSTDAVADVNTSGYFNDASEELAVGDIIELYTSTGGTAVMSRAYVLTNASGVVDITDGVVLAATDSD